MKTLKPERKGILISAIINHLNADVKKQNEKLCRQNLFSEQKPEHGGDMVFKLAFMPDKDFMYIVKACGI